ncbi:MAG: cysteine synthase, partial [Hyphomicrobiales bacterium]|nr:cysteine synthase [Hyphomicrobiales bacterium]
RTLGRSMARLHFDAVEHHFGKAPDETVVTFGTGATAVTFRREVISRGFNTRIADAAVAGGVSQPFYQSGDRSLRGQVRHRIEGVNTSFVPNSACRTAVDASVPIESTAAFAACLEMKELGLDCGPSSGLAIYCALVRAQQRQDAGIGGLISVPIYDGSARYPDTLFNADYLASLEPALTSYRRQIRIFTRSEVWMPLDCCGQAGKRPDGAGGAPAATHIIPTMWPIGECAA